MRTKVAYILLTALILFGTVYLSSQQEFVSWVSSYIDDQNVFVGYGAYILLLVASVVVAPITITPLIPFVATLFGPLIASLLTIVGWTAGSLVAFAIGRYAGRPLLEKFISLDKFDAFLERFPANSQFISVVLLHIILPSEIVSYSLGLAKSLSFIRYFGATLLGVSWSSFAFSYGGQALVKGDIIVLSQIVAVSVVIFAIAWYLLERSK